MRRLLKRWWFWTGAFLLLAILLANGAVIYSGLANDDEGPISQANFDKIQLGMTSSEVQSLLPGATGMALDRWENDGSVQLWCEPKDRWADPTGTAAIYLTFVNGKVFEKKFDDNRKRLSTIEKIKKRVKEILKL